MIEARKERVRELVRSLESLQVRGQALGNDRAFEGRSSYPTETGTGRVASCSAFAARQPPWPADRAKSHRTSLCSCGSEPDLACRYHLHSDGRGLALSGRRHGPLQPQNRRLGDARSHAGRARLIRPDHGDPPAAAGAWIDPSLRSPPSTLHRTIGQSCRRPASPHQ